MHVPVRYDDTTVSPRERMRSVGRKESRSSPIEVDVEDAQKTVPSLLVAVSSNRVEEMADDDISSNDGLGEEERE